MNTLTIIGIVAVLAVILLAMYVKAPPSFAYILSGLRKEPRVLIGTGGFQIPEPIVLEKRLKDVLEDDVDRKYFLSDKAIVGLLKHNENHEAKGTGFI